MLEERQRPRYTYVLQTFLLLYCRIGKSKSSCWLFAMTVPVTCRLRYVGKNLNRPLQGNPWSDFRGFDYRGACESGKRNSRPRAIFSSSHSDQQSANPSLRGLALIAAVSSRLSPVAWCAQHQSRPCVPLISKIRPIVPLISPRSCAFHPLLVQSWS